MVVRCVKQSILPIQMKTYYFILVILLASLSGCSKKSCSSSPTGLAINIVDSSGHNLLFGPYKKYNFKDIELYAQKLDGDDEWVKINAFGDSTNSKYNFAVPFLPPIQKYYLKFPASEGGEDLNELFIKFKEFSTPDCGKIYTVASIDVDGYPVTDFQSSKPIRIVKSPPNPID